MRSGVLRCPQTQRFTGAVPLARYPLDLLWQGAGVEF